MFPPARVALPGAVSPPDTLPRSVVRDVWSTPKRGAAAVPEAHERRNRVALTVAWMAATLAIALFVPDIGKVIELIGGISAFFIFIFPGKSERWEGGEGVTGAKRVAAVGLWWWVAHPGPILGVRGTACGGCHGGVWAKGAMTAGLSLCVGGRAVPGVHDWDPHPQTTQKVSVCGLGGAGRGRGTGTGRGRVQHPMTHGSGRVPGGHPGQGGSPTRRGIWGTCKH